VKYNNSWLNITVTDNGKGFDKESVRSGNGLLNMRSRAQMMKADIKIDSTPGEGTSIAWSSKIK
jgi:signal transduction histidine kinase